MKPKIFAHRGVSSVAPENTMAAFRRVPDSGADGVEFDVQLTKDGVPIVIHDEQLGRTCGGTGDSTGGVGEHNWDDLRSLDAGGWMDSGFEGEPIPTLSEVLAFFAETALVVNIELKTSLVPYPGLVPKVVALVQEMEMAPQIILSSFNHHSLLEAAAIAPDLSLAAAISDLTIAPWDYAKSHGFQALHPDFRICTPELVTASHALGLAVRPYTVDLESDFRTLQKMEVDGIITNIPQILQAVSKITA